MKKREIIKEKKEFNNIINSGESKKSNYFVICYKNNFENSRRFGIAVSKKTGNAVTRNTLKRRYRNIIDNNKLLFKNGFDYIIIVKKGSLEVSFETLNTAMKNILEKGEL